MGLDELVRQAFMEKLREKVNELRESEVQEGIENINDPSFRLVIDEEELEKRMAIDEYGEDPKEAIRWLDKYRGKAPLYKEAKKRLTNGKTQADALFEVMQSDLKYDHIQQDSLEFSKVMVSFRKYISREHKREQKRRAKKK